MKMTRSNGRLCGHMLAVILAATAPAARALDLAREDVREFAGEMERKHGFERFGYFW